MTLISGGLLIVGATALIFAVIGIAYARSKKWSLEDYISARNSIGLWASVGTLIASAMGAWILFSPAEASIIAGIPALIGYALGSAAAMFIFAWIGRRMRSLMPRGHTLTEYVRARYGKIMHLIVALIMVFYMSVFLAAELTGIALAGLLVFDIPLLYTALIVGVATVSYTALGGLRATIFTDKIQSWILLPLLMLLVGGVIWYLGGMQVSLSQAHAISPDLFNLGHVPGITFGVTLLIAIIGAELFNQARWQRVYAPKTKQIMSVSYTIAGLLVMPILLGVGMLGLVAINEGVADNASVALFTLLAERMPPFLVSGGMIVAVVLIMSSMDTLLNGLVSVLTVDIIRFGKKKTKKRALAIAQWLTVVLAGIAILVATQGHSVLYLFLVADLVCVAAAFPTLYGMFSQKFSGRAASVITLLSIIAGALLFPDPSFSRGNLLHSFVTALVVSSLLSIMAGNLGKKFDFKKLKKQVTSFNT